MSAEEAYSILKAHKKPEGYLCQMFESETLYFFNFYNDEEIIESVNKNGKSVSYMWMFDFLALINVEGDRIRDVDISKIS